jgi:hypothetical protein
MQDDVACEPIPTDAASLLAIFPDGHDHFLAIVGVNL